MTEATKTRTLVELVISEGNLCIGKMEEVARNPQILTSVEYVMFSPGYRDEAILRKAPKNANAYLGHQNFNPTSGIAMGSDLVTHIVYFRIDEEQASRAPQPKKEYR